MSFERKNHSDMPMDWRIRKARDIDRMSTIHERTK